MKTLKNRKWYLAHGMRRATHVRSVHAKIDVCAIQLCGLNFKLLAHTRGHVWTARGPGFDKEFAAKTAGVPPAKLMIYVHCDERAGQQLCERLTEELAAIKVQVEESMVQRGMLAWAKVSDPSHDVALGVVTDITFQPVQPAEHIEFTSEIAKP